MSLHAALASLVLDATLGAWLGVMAFFSFVGAPRAFAVFGDEAGTYVNDVFPRYYRVGVGLGTVAVAGGFARGALGGFGPTTLLVIAAAAMATLLAGYSLVGLLPRMEAAGDDAFEEYHRKSVVLNGVMLVAVALALVASHWP